MPGSNGPRMSESCPGKLCPCPCSTPPFHPREATTTAPHHRHRHRCTAR
ncbi:unnamed protein product [Spirodela intermedia]|uniref:Uncharacterized protein n=1 Tax=Spirodela intermedia TaxID=51605 RepID=A0ABN7EBU6_SPIIN|nr:unnamed protein product [Spirodela intermedia]